VIGYDLDLNPGFFDPGLNVLTMDDDSGSDGNDDVDGDCDDDVGSDDDGDRNSDDDDVNE
jgi:hypothetical protein